MGRTIRTCYIAAPAGANLNTLRSALESRNIRVLLPDHDSLDAFQKPAHTVARADLVIGVLTAQRRSQWVLFELGQASALERPIIMIGPPKSEAVPSHIKPLLYLRTGLHNREAIAFALDQLLAAPEPMRRLHVEEPRAGALGGQVDGLLQQLQQVTAAKDPIGLERLCAEVIRRSGAEVVTEKLGVSRRADMAIWSDELQPWLGNPLLIEIKMGIHNARGAEDAAKALSAAITDAGAVWGLLLLGDYEPASLSRLPPTILACSIEDLINQMRTRSFSDVVRDLRNRKVHGGSI